MSKFKILLVLLLSLSFAFSNNLVSLNDVTVHAKTKGTEYCEYLNGNNINAQNYTRSAEPVNSYLIPIDNGFMRVQGNGYDDGISVSYYDTEYNLTKRKKIASELPIFGGFLATDSAYYIVTGQSNSDENDKLEVYRITKYNKKWKRLGSCGLFGANTTIPFRAGSCRMDIDGKYLIVRTCHQMYKSSDGLNHQANVTIEVDTSDMKVTDSFTKVRNKSVGYVSHSFNQFVKVDDHSIVAVDHGDAYPRSICFMKYSTDISKGSFQGNVACTDVIAIPGGIGDNTTGASIGGFEISASSYLVAGNSVVQDEKNTSRSTRNIFVAVINKKTNKVNENWLTNFEEGEASASTPHLVKISKDKYMILWYRDSKIFYTYIDGNGKTSGKTHSFEGQLSDCAPVYFNGKVIWYTWNNGTEKFYEIPVDIKSDPSIKTLNFNHEYERVSINNSNITLKCNKCGKEISGNVLTGFKMYWKKSQDLGYYYSNVPNDIQKKDVIAFTYSVYMGFSEDNPAFYEMVMESDNPNCIVNWNEGTISFTKTGEYTVKAYPKYYPEAAQTFTFNVGSKSSVTPALTPTPTPNTDFQPIPTPDIKSVTERRESSSTINGITTKTIFERANGEFSITIKKSNNEETTEEYLCSEIDDTSVKINSYKASKKTVTIPETVDVYPNTYSITAIGSNVLGLTDSIKAVKLSSRITTIEENAFKNEKKIKKIEIYAANLQSVGKYAFKGIYSKAQIILIGTQKECENAEALIRASVIGKKIKIKYKTG